MRWTNATVKEKREDLHKEVNRIFEMPDNILVEFYTDSKGNVLKLPLPLTPELRDGIRKAIIHWAISQRFGL